MNYCASLWGYRLLKGIILISLLMPSRFHKKLQAQTLSVMSYNVENLFDTHHDEGFDDYEFLPEGANQWTEKRYRTKIENIAKVISDVGNLAWPDLVGLVEVENDKVLQDLTEKTELKNVGYKYYMTNGHDARGIDVALLYKPEVFHPDSVIDIPVYYQKDTTRMARNILHVRGHLYNEAILHVMVVHLPSQRLGVLSSREKRKEVVRHLQSKCDSILARCPEDAILVMGDFNCTPRAVETLPWAHLLSTRNTHYKRHIMYDITSRRANGEIPGSYRFRNVWEQIDRMVVSGNMLYPQHPISYRWDSARSVRIRRWMQQKKDGTYVPKRTYANHFYIGGVSDHLPIVAHFKLTMPQESAPIKESTPTLP